MSTHDINFLPDWYRQRKHKRRTLARHTCLLIALLSLMGTWVVTAREQRTVLESQARAAESRAHALAQQQQAYIALVERQNLLQQQLDTRRRLEAPFQPSQLIATLARQMPQSMTLLRLEIRNPQPLLDPPSTAQASPQRTRNQATAARFTQIEIRGIAPSDTHIATFVEHLGRHPLFQDVKMVYSRSVDHDLVHCRGFLVEARIPHDVYYQVVLDDRPGTRSPTLATFEDRKEARHHD